MRTRSPAIVEPRFATASMPDRSVPARARAAQARSVSSTSFAYGAATGKR